MSTFKTYFRISILALIVLEALAVVIYSKKLKKTEEELKIAAANIKSYEGLLSSADKKNAAFLLTTEQLKNSKDSILMELESSRKKLKIKEKDIKAEQYISSSFSKTDTVVIQDTIFKDKEVAVDTLIGDEWYNAKVSLKYPSTIIVSPSFKSNKNIIVSTKKETINPPKKLWILRLFQKKHTVLKVDVVEKNPYVKKEDSRYVEILK